MKTVEPGLYKHYKGGEYRVIGTASDVDSAKQFVIYHTNVEGYETVLFARSLTSWHAPVLGSVYRFERIGD